MTNIRWRLFNRNICFSK